MASGAYKRLPLIPFALWYPLATMHKQATAGTLPPPLCCADPYEIKLGVTGHRKLGHPENVRRGVERVLADLDRLLGTIQHRYIILSPLADGADRLVADTVLAWRGLPENQFVGPAALEVRLPMPVDEYVKTFDAKRRAESEREFHELLAKAAHVTVMPEASSHKAAYEEVGRALVRECDILLAVWDRKAGRGRGGTAEIVQFARTMCRSTFCVDPGYGIGLHKLLPFLPYKPLFDDPGGFLNQICSLGEYNREQPKAGTESIADEVERRSGKLETRWHAEGLDTAILQQLKSTILPNQVKASRLARKYQSLYFNSVLAAYALSAAAVFCAAAGQIFLKERSSWIFYVESGLILLAMFLAFRFDKWKSRWIDYRYIAERLRSSYFLYLAGLEQDQSEAPPDLELSSLPEVWTDAVIRDAWRGVPPFRHTGRHENAAHLEAKVAAFLKEAWIDGQKKYYDNAARQNHQSRERLEAALKTIVAVTLVAAVCHGLLHKIWPGEGSHPAVPDTLSLLAVTLPAVASVLAGISVFRNFSRNAESYESMSRHLASISERMSGQAGATYSPAQPAPVTALQELVHEANWAMSHEHRSWRSVFGIRLPGPG